MISEAKTFTASPLADYDFWFLQDRWTLKEAAALVVGLNPDVVLNPEIRTMYNNGDISDNAKYKIWHPLWRYSEEAVCAWHKVLDQSERDINGAYCADEMGDIVDGNLTVKPMEFIQWCVDNNVRMHYRLTEHLQGKCYDFRFSKNSRILSELQVYARKDVWFMPFAARLVLGLSPDATKEYLKNRRNLYRHLDPNYTFTQRDEIYHIMESALESWKTKNLEFFEIYGDDPEEGYFSIENCPVNVDARKFVEWAIKKGFSPPVQLLEFMGIKAAQKPECHPAFPEKQGTAKPLLTKEKETLLKIIIAMAIKGYGYDPKASKSKTPQEICDDLVKLGIPLNPDTVRAKLKNAVNLLPQEAEIKTAKPKSV